MAIDEKHLDSDRPSSSAVERLRNRKRKKRIRPWQTELVDEQIKSNENTPSNEQESIVASDALIPTLDTHKVEIDEPRSSGPIEPGSNLVQTRFDNQVHKPGSNLTQSQIFSRPSEPGSNMVHQPGSDLVNFNALELEMKTIFIDSGSITKTEELDYSSKLDSHIGFVPSDEPGANMVHQPGSQHPDKIHLSGLIEPGLNPVQTRFDNQVQQNRSRDKQVEPSSNPVQTEFKPSSNPVPDPVHNLVHNLVQNKLTIEEKYNLEATLISLSGNNLKIFNYIAVNCINSAEDHLVTGSDFLSHALGIPVESLRTSFKRLMSKGLIENTPLKMGGRGAKRKISIPKATLNLYAKHLLNMGSDPKPVQYPVQNPVQTGFKPGSVPGSDTSSKLVSNNFNNSNLLTSPDQMLSLYEGYDSINLESVQSLGVTKKQINDIRNQKLELTSFQLQELVDKFGEYAKDPKNKVNFPPGLFVKMAQEMSRGEDPLPNIKSNSDLELDLMKEALIKQVKEKQGRVAEIQKLAFEDWFLASSDEDKKKLMPNTVNLDQNIYKNALRAAWVETHWPSSEFALRLS